MIYTKPTASLMTTACVNCGCSLEEQFEYCPQCAQKTRLHRLSLHDILHDALHFFIHADKSVLHLLKDLATKTGTVAKEFVSGKRKKYFPPLNFFLLVATVYVLVVTFSADHSKAPDILKDHPEVNYIPDPVQKANVIRIWERQHIAVNFLNRYSNIISMIVVPLIALIFSLFYARRKYNYTEHLVANMYMAGFCNLIFAIIIIPIGYLFGLKGGASALPAVYAFFIFQVVYYSIYYYRFLDRNKPVEYIKAFFVSAAAMAFWFFLSGFIVRQYIVSGFGGLMK